MRTPSRNSAWTTETQVVWRRGEPEGRGRGSSGETETVRRRGLTIRSPSDRGRRPGRSRTDPSDPTRPPALPGRGLASPPARSERRRPGGGRSHRRAADGSRQAAGPAIRPVRARSARPRGLPGRWRPGRATIAAGPVGPDQIVGRCDPCAGPRAPTPLHRSASSGSSSGRPAASAAYLRRPSGRLAAPRSCPVRTALRERLYSTSREPVSHSAVRAHVASAGSFQGGLTTTRQMASSRTPARTGLTRWAEKPAARLSRTSSAEP
jgi:hypothetical protein